MTVKLEFASLDDLAHACRGPAVTDWMDSAFRDDDRDYWRKQAQHLISLSAPQPLQQGGEVTRAMIEAAFEPLRSEDDERYGNVVNGTLDEARAAILALFASPDLGDLAGLVERLCGHAADAVSLPAAKRDLVDGDLADLCIKSAAALRSLAADRDKAVGLLRRWLPHASRYDPVAVETRVFLSSQTGGQ